MSVNFVHLNFIRALIVDTLRNKSPHQWTVQGFGFLRTYFGPADNPKRFRLNLWDSRFTVPNVSTIHDHPWDLSSLIAGGAFCNQRYDVLTEEKPDDVFYLGATHLFATIKTGVSGGMEKTPTRPARLRPQRPEVYGPGDVYSQCADEVHETLFADGSITINERIGDTEHARVFWPMGYDWVDAKPRPATPDEVKTAIDHSLARWFQ